MTLAFSNGMAWALLKVSVEAKTILNVPVQIHGSIDYRTRIGTRFEGMHGISSYIIDNRDQAGSACRV